MDQDGKPIILVVEDDPDLRQILRLQLTVEGYAVQEAGDGQAAVQMVQQNDYACILLDLMMPGMDGFSFLKRLRVARRTADVPVIVLTASHDQRHRQRSDQYLAHAFMTKPYDLDELTRTIQRLLDESASRSPAPAS